MAKKQKFYVERPDGQKIEVFLEQHMDRVVVRAIGIDEFDWEIAELSHKGIMKAWGVSDESGFPVTKDDKIKTVKEKF